MAILAEDPANPIVGGDIISNPLFDADEPIHVFIVGELQKYPLSIAERRLNRMNVIIDAEPYGETDYFVVPDALAAPAPETTDDDDGFDDDEGQPAGASEYEKIQQVAKNFGATVITERMLNEFLDF